MFPETIETDRLELKRLDEHVGVLDYYEVCAHDPDIEEITEHMTWTPHDSPKETADYLDSVTEGWEAGEGAQYGIFPKDADELAGTGGIDVDWDRRLGSLGCWLRKPYWGRGYSGERADALIGLAFDTLDLDCIAVTHAPGNEKSERAITKYVERHGGRREGHMRHALAYQDGTVSDEIRYTITQAEYEAARS